MRNHQWELRGVSFRKPPFVVVQFPQGLALQSYAVLIHMHSLLVPRRSDHARRACQSQAWSPRRNGTVLMNMLERLLETTEIDARDVETEQTLLLHETLRNHLDEWERSHHAVTVNDG